MLTLNSHCVTAFNEVAPLCMHTGPLNYQTVAAYVL